MLLNSQTDEQMYTDRDITPPRSLAEELYILCVCLLSFVYIQWYKSLGTLKQIFDILFIYLIIYFSVKLHIFCIRCCDEWMCFKLSSWLWSAPIMYLFFVFFLPSIVSGKATNRFDLHIFRLSD